MPKLPDGRARLRPSRSCSSAQAVSHNSPRDVREMTYASGIRKHSPRDQPEAIGNLGQHKTRDMPGGIRIQELAAHWAQLGNWGD